MIASSGSAAPSAIRAAPVLSGASFGPLWEMPSGKIAIAPPRLSSSRARVKVSRLSTAAPEASCRRNTGIVSSERMSAPMTGMPNSVDLPRNETGRGATARMMPGSTSALGWLTTNITGPSPGTASTPVSSTSRKKICSCRSISARSNLRVRPGRDASSVTPAIVAAALAAARRADPRLRGLNHTTLWTCLL